MRAGSKGSRVDIPEEDLNEQYLLQLVKSREFFLREGDGHTAEVAASYLQGRIDEYCSQNAIDQEDFPDIDLKLPPETEE